MMKLGMRRDAPPGEGAQITDADLLTPRVDAVLFTATTNCNLRCTYCGVSLPTYRGADFDFSYAERLAGEMKRANVQMVQINGHGETTMLPNWHEHCRAFQAHGIQICITSNFAVIYNEEEIETLARMAGVTVSIDTVDRDLLREIRRKVDLRTILYNMQRVRLRAKRLGVAGPWFNWQCTLSDKVAAGVLDWVDMGLLHGVTNFTFGNLIEHKGLPDTPRHVAHMEKEPLLQAASLLREALQRAKAAGANVSVQGGIVEGINEGLKRNGVNQPFALEASA